MLKRGISGGPVCRLLLLLTRLILIAVFFSFGHVLASVDHCRLCLLRERIVIGADGLSWVQLALVQVYILIHLVLVLGTHWFMDINGILFYRICWLG